MSVKVKTRNEILADLYANKQSRLGNNNVLINQEEPTLQTEDLSSANQEIAQQNNDINNTNITSQLANKSEIVYNNAVKQDELYQEEQQELDAEKQQYLDSRNGWQRFVDMTSDWINNLNAGVLNFVDDVSDIFINIGGEIEKAATGSRANADAAMDTDWVSSATNFLDMLNVGNNILNGDYFSARYWNDWANSMATTDKASKRLDFVHTSNLITQVNGEVSDFLGGVVENIGYMVPSIVAAYFSGGSTAVAQAVGLGVMGVGAFGGGMKEARSEGADFGHQALYGALNAGVEVGTEIIGDKLTGIGIGGIATNLTGETLTKTLMKTFIDESMEEVASALVNPVIKASYKGADAFFDENGNNVYGTSEFWKDVGLQGLAGGLTGVLMGGTTSAYNYAKYGTSGVNYMSALGEYTENMNELTKMKNSGKANTSAYQKLYAETEQTLAKVNKFGNDIISSGNQTQIDNIANKLLGKEDMSSIDTIKKSVSDINTNYNIKNINEISATKLVSDLSKSGVNLKSFEFGDTPNGALAFYDNGKVVINKSLVDDAAPRIAHEVIGHSTWVEMNSDLQNETIDLIKKSSNYSTLSAQIVDAYREELTKAFNNSETSKYKPTDAELMSTDLFKEELYTNYLQETTKSSADITSDYLDKSIIKKVLKTFKNLLNTNQDTAIHNQIVSQVNAILNANKDFRVLFSKLEKGMALNSNERALYKNNKEVIDQIKFSKELKNIPAQYITDSANLNKDSVLSLKSSQDIYINVRESLKSIGFDISKIDEKSRALFENANSRRTNYETFVNEILDTTNESGMSLREFIQFNGLNPNEMLGRLTQDLTTIIENKATKSVMAKTIERYNNVISIINQKYSEYKQKVSIANKLENKVRNLVKTLKAENKSSTTNKIQVRELNPLLQLVNGRISTQGGVASGSYRRKFNQLVNSTVKIDGKQVAFLDYLQNSDLNVQDILTGKGELDSAIEVFKALAESYDPNKSIQSSLTLTEAEQLVQAYGTINKVLKDYKNNVYAQVSEIASKSYKKQTIKGETQKNGYFTTKAKGFINKIINPITVWKTSLTKSVYNDTMGKLVKAYSNQKLDYANFTNEFRDILGNNKSTLKKGANKSVEWKGIKVARSSLYGLYMNLTTMENAERIQANGYSMLNSKNKLTKTFAYEPTLLSEVSSILTESEMNELESVSDFLNTRMKQYVSNAQNSIDGFSNMLDTKYYPLAIDSNAISKDLTALNKDASFMVDAGAWNSIKGRVGANAPLTMFSPLSVVENYIKSATMYAQLTVAEREVSRIFNTKFDGKNSLRMKMNEIMPEFNKQLASFMNKLNGNNVDTSGALINRLGGNYASAVLGFNISSASKQWGSLPTASVKTGLVSSIKALFKANTYDLLKTYNYLKENNGVFANRILDNGFVQSQTLANSNSITSGVSNVFSDITDIASKPMEWLDTLWCLVEFGQAQQTIQDQYGYKIGSQENLDKANELFDEILLETQSNADSIAKSMLRSGELGAIQKWVFGTFAADSQQKLSLLYESLYTTTSANATIKYCENELNKGGLSQADIDFYNNEIQEAKASLKNGKVLITRNAVSLLTSGILTTLAEMLVSYLLGKKDDEEIIDPMNILTSVLQNTFIEWVPFVSTIYSAVEYNNDLSIMPLSSLNDLIGVGKNIVSSIQSGTRSKTLPYEIGAMLSKLMGLPVENVLNIVLGITDKISPELALEWKSILKGYSASYFNTIYGEQLDNGHTKSALTTLTANMSIYKVSNSTSEVLNELNQLNALGYSCTPKSYMTSYTDSEDNEIKLSDEQIKQFRYYYDLSTDQIDKLIKSDYYQSLSEENKAKAIKKVYDTYYDYAKEKITSVASSTKLSRLLAMSDNKIDVSTLIIAYQEVKDIQATKRTDRKTLITKELNKISGLTKAEKLLVLSLLGYSITDLNKSKLIAYLTKNGFSRKQAKEFIGA